MYVHCSLIVPVSTSVARISLMYDLNVAEDNIAPKEASASIAMGFTPYEI